MLIAELRLRRPSLRWMGLILLACLFLTEKVKLDLADDIDLEAFLKEANEIADRIEPGSVIKEK